MILYDKDGLSIEESPDTLIFNLKIDDDSYGLAFRPPITIEALYYGFKTLYENVKAKTKSA